MLKKLVSKGFSALAQRAVESAEANFGPGKGLAKKRFAVNFILARIPLPLFLRTIAENFLVEAVGIAVETACERLSGE